MSPLLKKSFNSEKCKTLLQLIVKKLMILRNKHVNSVKSSRADVARLLEKDQDSSAKTRVENVYREEKTVALYNLLEQFCQLIIDRFESMKSQRECPSELKEAVASLIYAGQRCAEIDELKKVSDYLSKKFGTEFSLSAKELRSGCGVNTQVIQTLSSLPLSYDTRMKLLKDIAVENQIKWDFDTAIANSSMQPADVLDGPAHFVSGTQVSHASIHATFDKQASMSMHVKEVNQRAGGALKNSFSSGTMSPRTPLHSPHHNVHQQTNIETKGSRARNSRGMKSITTDPYALAKAEGKMDYKLVSDYMGGKPLLKDCFDPASLSQVPDQEGQSMLPGSSKSKQMSRQETELCLLDLEAAAKMALTSASEAAEAARVAVAMVRKESLGRNALATTKNTEGRHPRSSSVSVLDESSSMSDGTRFSSMQHNVCADAVLNDHVQEDTSGDLFKYVVLEQSSGSQVGPSQVQDSLKPEHEGLRSIEVPSSPCKDNFSRTKAEKEEVDWKRSYTKKQGSFNGMEVQHDETVQNISSAPKFDDYTSDDATEDETPVHPSEHAKSAVNLSDETEMQQDKYVQHECTVPQFDDETSKDVSEEASDEKEIPFYLKGRPAMVKEDYADGTVRVLHSSKLTTNLLTDNWMEESLSTSPRSTEEVSSLHYETLTFSSNQGKQAATGVSPHSQELRVFTPGRSFKNTSRMQVDVASGGFGLMNSVSHNDNFFIQDDRQKMRLSSLSYESSYLDSSCDEIPSHLSSVRLSPTGGLSDDDEAIDPSHLVRRDLKLWSTISEDDPLEAPKLSLRVEALKPTLSRQGIQASPRKYQGMSKRSIRPTRPRHDQDIPSGPPE